MPKTPGFSGFQQAFAPQSDESDTTRPRPRVPAFARERAARETLAVSPSSDLATFEQMMALESHGADTFVGVGPRYPWGGLYGGQIVAQSLRAAGLTVDAGFHPHSLHSYFIRPGSRSTGSGTAGRS